MRVLPITFKKILQIVLVVGCVASQLAIPATRVAPEILLSQPLTVRWKYESNVTLNLTPAFDNERIYLPLAGGTIVALKARDGQLLWRSEMGGELSASPVADDAMIYVSSEALSPMQGHVGGALRALGREGGVTQWMTPLVRPLRGSLALNGGKLFAGGIDGRAYAFDKRTGGVLWSIPFGAALNGHPVLLQLALRNLVENALGHTPPGTQVEVQLDPQARWLQVCDNGAQVAGRGAAPVAAPVGLGLGLGLGHHRHHRQQPRSRSAD